MEVRVGGKRRQVPSYLPALLTLAAHTGRRISSIVAVQWHDVLWGNEFGPHGAIRWRADAEKTRRETVIPMSPEVRAVFDQIRAERAGIGASYIFASPANPQQPVRVETASAWLLEAEQRATLPKLDGSLWHAFRRGWATSKKHLSPKDVAEAGGWKDVSTLQQIYQQPDPQTLYSVVSDPTVLRKFKPAEAQ